MQQLQSMAAWPHVLYATIEGQFEAALGIVGAIIGEADGEKNNGKVFARLKQQWMLGWAVDGLREEQKPMATHITGKGLPRVAKSQPGPITRMGFSNP